MPNLSLTATVSDDLTLKWDNPARLKAFLATGKGLSVYVTMDREPRRSLAANRRYWGGIVPFAQQVWENERGLPYSKEMAHIALKIAFHPHGCDEVMIGGQAILVPKSTTRLNSQEFSEYCDACEGWIFSRYGVTAKELQSE